MVTTRLTVWLVVAALATATFSFRAALRTKPASAERPKVLFITGGDTPYWQITADGARAAADEYQVDLTARLPDGGHEQQSEILRAGDASDFDGVAISPRSPEQQNELLREVADEVRLVTFDSDAPNSGRLCYVGTDNYSAGRLAAQLTKNAVPGGGKVAILVATFEKDNAILRVQGFQEEIRRVSPFESGSEPSNYELLEPLEDGINRQKCRASIKMTLEQHPDLAAFVGMFSYHGPLLLEVLKELDLEKRPQLVVFDEEEAVLDGISSGDVYGTIIQDPFKYGYESVRMLAALQKGRSIEVPIAGSGSLFLPCDAITPENLAAFRERLATRARR